MPSLQAKACCLPVSLPGGLPSPCLSTFPPSSTPHTTLRSACPTAATCPPTPPAAATTRQTPASIARVPQPHAQQSAPRVPAPHTCLPSRLTRQRARRAAESAEAPRPLLIIIFVHHVLMRALLRPRGPRPLENVLHAAGRALGVLVLRSATHHLAAAHVDYKRGSGLRVSVGL